MPKQVTYPPGYSGASNSTSSEASNSTSSEASNSTSSFEPTTEVRQLKQTVRCTKAAAVNPPHVPAVVRIPATRKRITAAKTTVNRVLTKVAATDTPDLAKMKLSPAKMSATEPSAPKDPPSTKKNGGTKKRGTEKKRKRAQEGVLKPGSTPNKRRTKMVEQHERNDRPLQRVWEDLCYYNVVVKKLDGVNEMKAAVAARGIPPTQDNKSFTRLLREGHPGPDAIAQFMADSGWTEVDS